MRLWVRSNGLSLFFFVLFAGALVGQSLAGLRVFNEEQVQHGAEPISYARYLVSSHFGAAVLENCSRSTSASAARRSRNR